MKNFSLLLLFGLSVFTASAQTYIGIDIQIKPPSTILHKRFIAIPDTLPGGACNGISIVVYGGDILYTVEIGSQCWFKNNLSVGTKINSNQNQTDNGIIEKYCYDDLDSLCKVYGGLYQWSEMVQYLNGANNTTNWNPIPTGDVQGICPGGWHIPTNGEWGALVTYLGGVGVAGGMIKEKGYTHYLFPNTAATNSVGFTALPAGERWSNGNFYYKGKDAIFWTVSPGYNPNTDVYYRGASYSIAASTNGQFYKVTGLSTRCLKDRSLNNGLKSTLISEGEVEKPSMLIYPNPTNGNFTLLLKGDHDLENVEVKVYTMDGVMVMNERLHGEKQHEFSMVDFSDGLYFVMVTADGSTEILKLIKMK